MNYKLFFLAIALIIVACQSEPQVKTEKVLAKVTSQQAAARTETKIAPVYASYDYGMTWKPLHDIFHDSVGVARLGKIDDQIIVSTFDAGLFLGQASEKKWQQIGADLPQKQINALHVSSGTIFVGLYRNGIYKSSDKGATWASMNHDLKDLRVQSILAHQEKVFVGTDSGIFSYSEQKESWQHLFAGVQVNSLSADSNKMIAATNKGMLLSKDDGLSWQWIRQEGAVFNAMILQDGALMSSQGSDLYRSKNEGATWDELFYFPSSKFNIFKTAQLDQTVIMTNRNGVYRSDDSGNTWFQTFQYTDLPFSELFADPTDRIIYASGMSGC
ncbi:MAG: sialidase family protein [Bacteroidota bacterium]